jgi:hypothetical protein
VDIATFIAMVMDLGAKIHGAEMRYLGAMVHGAEVRVHFLKSFQKGRICEILFKKRAKKQKSRDHFPLPFINKMLERLENHAYFCFLDGYTGFMQIPIHLDDQHKTTFTCPYGTFAYRRMPFGLCNAPASFQ